MLSGRGFCDELITPSEESYRLLYDVVCGIETSNEEALDYWGLFCQNQTRREFDSQVPE
jgi:hypothetical protein